MCCRSSTIWCVWFATRRWRQRVSPASRTPRRVAVASDARRSAPSCRQLRYTLVTRQRQYQPQTCIVRVVGACECISLVDSWSYGFSRTHLLNPTRWISTVIYVYLYVVMKLILKIMALIDWSTSTYHCITAISSCVNTFVVPNLYNAVHMIIYGIMIMWCCEEPIAPY